MTMHPICVYCGSPYCTCFDTDEEYATVLEEYRRTKPMVLEEINAVGPCVVCGEPVGNSDWRAGNVIAVIEPNGSVLAHASHVAKGPGDPEYKKTVRLMAEATAKLLRLPKPNPGNGKRR